jgi:hypothetical protein
MSRGVVILLLEMKIMEISLRNLSAPRTLSGLVKTVASFSLDTIRIPSPDALPYKMFMYGIPYKASETYRIIRDDFESNKSLAMLETRRTLSRC